MNDNAHIMSEISTAWKNNLIESEALANVIIFKTSTRSTETAAALDRVSSNQNTKGVYLLSDCY